MKTFFSVFFSIAMLLGNSVSCFAEENASEENQKSNAQAVFAVNWYQKNVKEAPDSNIVTSPFGIYRLLGALYLGSDGQTAAQIQTLLGQNGSKEQFLKETADLFNSLKQTGDLNIADGLWVHDGYSVRDSFVNTIKEMGNTDVRDIDFSTSAALEEINRWGREATHGKIPQMLPNLSGEPRMVIANAIFFDGKWEQAFDEENTRDGYFTTLAGKDIMFPIMQRKGEYSYLQKDNFQWLEIPYQGEKFAMGILLPNSHENFRDVEKKFSKELLDECRANAKKQKVDLRLPKFTFNNSAQAAPLLKKMGISDAFSTSANFTPISNANDLMLSQVSLNAFLSVNEKGTQAAATAAAEIVAKSIAINRDPSFYVDRPFIFTIFDLQSETILFCGRIVNPEKINVNETSKIVDMGENEATAKGVEAVDSGAETDQSREIKNEENANGSETAQNAENTQQPPVVIPNESILKKWRSYWKMRRGPIHRKFMKESF